MKPIIGIVGRENLSDSDGRSIISTSDEYRRAIIKAGGIPFTILPTQDYEYPHFNLNGDRQLNQEEKDDLITILKNSNGVIIPGGCKIFEYDKFIANYCIENDIPVLGICLGMQVLGYVDCNSNVVKPIDNGVNHNLKSQKFAHNVKILKNSKLFEILQSEEFKVNSRHRCNITKTNQFDIVGKSQDGVIEAIERKDKKFAIGIQWHPEMIYDESLEAQRLFKYFINSCKN